MNERIKQMATEVGISVEYLNNTKQWLLIEALAERIVGECVKIAYQNDVAKFTRDGYVIGQEIEKHFGVE